MQLLTILIPVYNGEKTIAAAVESTSRVRGASILVVDDGSTDGTVSVINELKARFPDLQLIHNAENEGTLAARCRGIAAATGRYVLQVDADDVILPLNVERVLARAAELNYPDVVHFNSLISVPDDNGAIKQEEYSIASPVLFGIALTGKQLATAIMQQRVSHGQWGKLQSTEMMQKTCKEILTDPAYVARSRLVYGEDYLLSFVSTKHMASYVGVNITGYVYHASNTPETGKTALRNAWDWNYVAKTIHRFASGSKATQVFESARRHFVDYVLVHAQSMQGMRCAELEALAGAEETLENASSMLRRLPCVRE